MNLLPALAVDYGRAHFSAAAAMLASVHMPVPPKARHSYFSERYHSWPSFSKVFSTICLSLSLYLHCHDISLPVFVVGKKKRKIFWFREKYETSCPVLIGPPRAYVPSHGL